MRQRAIIHIAGFDRSGKTAFVEALLHVLGCEGIERAVRSAS